MKTLRPKYIVARFRSIQVFALALALLTLSFAGWRTHAARGLSALVWRSQPLPANSPAAASRRAATAPPRDVAALDPGKFVSSQGRAAAAALLSGNAWSAMLAGPMFANAAPVPDVAPEVLSTVEIGNITQACAKSIVVNVPGRNDPQAAVTLVNAFTATPQASQNISYVTNSGCSSNGNPCTVTINFTGRVVGDTTGQISVLGGYLTNGVLTTTHLLIIPLHGTVLAPSLSCSADINTSTDQGQCTATVNIVPPSAPASCYSAPSGTRSDGQSLTAPYPVGTTTITWNSSATLSGNTYPVACTQKVNVTGTATPSIVTPPQPQTVCAGQPATFSVGATGTGLTYQWRKGGQPINGAKSSSYTIASTTANDTGSYDVVVGSACGVATVTSTPVNLTVNPATAINTPPANQTKTIGQSVTFSVGAVGLNLGYQWRKGGQPINGATQSSYTINAVALTDAGNYDVVVMGACGTATSSPAMLTVNCQTITVNNPATTTGTAGAAFSQTFTQAGGNGTTTFSTTSVLPNGLTLASNGTLSGTPTQTGTFPIVVTAPDQNGCIGTSATYNLNIACVTNLVVTTDADSGAGSLREAIAIACPGSTITFANGISLITLTSGNLVVDKNLTIQGPGANLLTISGNQMSRVFYVNSGVTATFDALTIANGMVTGPQEQKGGGLFNLGSVTLTNCTLSGNVVSGVAVSRGGGIANDGTMTITASTLSGNMANGALNCDGGGIYTQGPLTITNSTLNGNAASGGIGSHGGGIYNNNGGPLTLINCTVSGNAASGRSGTQGGGIHNQFGSTSSRNTIIAGNSAGSGPDVYGTLTSQGHNLISNTSNTTITGDTTGNLLNQNPLLGALASNGGPTQTLVLLPGSPAINAGDNCVTQNPGCLTTPLITDQRGAGFPRKVGTAVDIGAFEVQNATPTILGATISQPIASPATTAQIATVGDAEDAANTLSVTATPLSGSSVTVTNLSVDANGNVTADIQAACGATNSTFTLTVTDSGNAFATAQLIVNVSANTPPILTYPSNPGTVYGTGITVSPLTGPSDNGKINSVQVYSVVPAISGGVTVDSAGVVTIAGTLPAGTYTVTIRATDDCGAPTDASFPLGIVKATPVITWNNPADITYGTALSATQLNASSNVVGSFTYTPPLTTILNAGNGQTLSVQFTPTDTANYTNASKSGLINVLKATPVISWSNPADITYGTALGSAQLNASANVAGNFVYTPAANTVLSAGNAQTLSVTFTPTDTANYTNAAKIVVINVLKATPALMWSPPADIMYGTALGATQLNATANVAGNFNYSPASGIVLYAGNGQLLTVNFTPTDTNNFATASKQVTLNVLKAPLTATVNNAWRNQGEANPPFSGSLLGLTNGDVITASYSTTANVGSVPGDYPITALLSDPGNRLSNYQVTNTASTLTILNSCGITVNPTTLPAATRGTPFAQTLSASPTGSYVFSLLAGALPPGLSLVNVLGIYSLRGTPTTQGTYTFTLKAKKNNSTCESARTYTISIP